MSSSSSSLPDAMPGARATAPAYALGSAASRDIVLVGDRYSAAMVRISPPESFLTSALMCASNR